MACRLWALRVQTESISNAMTQRMWRNWNVNCGLLVNSYNAGGNLPTNPSPQIRPVCAYLASTIASVATSSSPLIDCYVNKGHCARPAHHVRDQLLGRDQDRTSAKREDRQEQHQLHHHQPESNQLNQVLGLEMGVVYWCVFVAQTTRWRECSKRGETESKSTN